MAKKARLTEEQYNFLKGYEKQMRAASESGVALGIASNEIGKVYNIFNAAFEQHERDTACATCRVRILAKLNTLYTIYEQEHAATAQEEVVIQPEAELKAEELQPEADGAAAPEEGAKEAAQATTEPVDEEITQSETEAHAEATEEPKAEEKPTKPAKGKGKGKATNATQTKK